MLPAEEWGEIKDDVLNQSIWLLFIYFLPMAESKKTWSEFVIELEEKIFQSTEDGSWKTLSVSNVDGTSQTFLSLEEMVRALELARNQAVTADGASNRSKYRPIRLRARTSRR